MKSTKSLLFALFLLVGQFTFQAYAVNDIVTVGATGSTYTTLKLVFDAINAGTLTGDIQLQIKDNTTETASAELISGGIVSITKGNAGTGYTSAPTVVISAPPTGGIQAVATVTVTGGGLNVFTITNPGAGYTTAPTISFTGGGGTGATATATLAAANFTSVKIYPIVTTKTISGGIGGKSLIVLSGVNNVTFDGRLYNSSGVLTGSTRDLTITNTQSQSGSMTVQFRHNASNNTVNFCKIKGSGTSTSVGIITLNNPATSSATGNYNNIISNNIFSAASTRPFVVIYSVGISGAVNTGNQFLDNDLENCLAMNNPTTCVNFAAYNNACTFTGNSFYETAANTQVQVNSAFTYLSVASGNNHTISNNYIGGTLTQCGGGTFAKNGAANNQFIGILFTSTDAGTPSRIENNVFKNITWTNGTSSTATWTAISVTGAHDISINGNTIGNISITNSATGSNIIGINKTAGTAIQTINKNFIYGLTSTAASSGQLYGIYVSGGLSTLSNNIISLNHNNDVSTIGIYDHGVAGKTANWYFNTVRIGGTAPTSGTKGSYAFWSQGKDNTRDFRNNIFVNARTNGGSPAATGSHYAAYFNYSANTNLTLSNNNYYVSGTGGVLGRYGGANKTALPIVTDKDANSVNVNPSFAIPTGTAAVDFKPSDATLTGVAISGITTDYSGVTTRNVPTMGAWEVAITLDVPGAPSIGTATAGNTQASVTFTAPVSNGGSAILDYTVTSSTGGITATGSSSPIVVTGLTNGTAYTFTVKARNAQGSSVASSASNSVTPIAVPDAPTIGTATRGNAQASVAFTAPSNTGDSPITGYTVTSSPGGITGTGASSPIVVTGLTNGTAYTFTVTATNTQGTSVPSAASNSVTPATVPGAPTIGTATRGNAQASVTFTAPASNGGSAITGYTVTSSPGDITATGSSSPIVITGLTNGTAYTFTVTATNAAGTGAASLASNSVTPINDVPEIAAPVPTPTFSGV